MLVELLNSCDDLRVKSLIVVLALLLSVPALAKDCPQDQPKTEAALLQLEQNWADALSRKDADTVACMVADEFEDADVDGSLHTRSQMLTHIPRAEALGRITSPRCTPTSMATSLSFAV